MPGKSPGPSIKNPKVYEALRRKGYSKEKAARISNALAKDSFETNRSLPSEVLPCCASPVSERARDFA